MNIEIFLADSLPRAIADRTSLRKNFSATACQRIQTRSFQFAQRLGTDFFASHANAELQSR